MLDEDDLAAERASKRRTAISMAVLAVVVVGAGVGIRQYLKGAERKAALQTAATSWAALQRCLIGAPLAAGEDLMWRVHRVEVNREPIPPGIASANLTDRWPYRCAAQATALRDALAALEPPDAAQQRLRAAAERTRSQLTRGLIETARDAQRTGPPHLEALWAAARAVTLPPPGALPPGDAAPPPSAMLTRADLVPLFPAAANQTVRTIATDRTPGATLHVAMGNSTLYLCAFVPAAQAEQHLAAARCQAMGPLEGATSEALDASMLDTDDAFAGVAPVRIGGGPSARIVGLPGADAADQAAARYPHAFRGLVVAPGVANVIDSAGQALDDAAAAGRWRLSRVRGASRTNVTVVLPRESSRPDFAGNRLVYLAPSEPGHGPARVGLFSRALLDTPAMLGPAVDAGDVPEDSRIAGRCRTGDGAAVVVAAPSQVLVALTRGDGWTTLGHAEGRSQSVAIACGATDATATWLDARGTTIHQLRCTPAGCREAQARAPAAIAAVIARGADYYDLTDFDGRVMMAWTTPDGGVRFRLAPLAEFEGARDVVVYDDGLHRGGAAHNPSVFVRRNVAVITFVDAERPAEGHRAVAVRVDHDGGFRAVTAAL